MDHNDLSKETKLSEAIEMAIRSEEYANAGHYMCIALQRMDLEQHVEAVEDMVITVHRNQGKSTKYRGLPLICAAHDAGIIDVNKTTCLEDSQFTTQLYCWWVFDLKRKGL